MSHRHVLLLSLLFHACAGGGDGDGGDGADGPSADAVAACKATCDDQHAACPDTDLDDCHSLCDAWAFVLSGDACAEAMLEYEDCQAGLTWECFDGFAFPEDSEACDGAWDTWQTACE